MASKVVKQLAGNGSGQSLADRVNAAKYSLAGSGLGKGVIKATTEEMVPPKKKHLDYLMSCTNEVNVSIPELAEYLIDRMQQTSAVVVMKTFITTHHLLNFGNEKFSQYLAAKDNQLTLPGFVDKSSASCYEMSQYIKMYSKYVNEKTVTYRLMAFDFCKIKRGRDDGVLRRMPMEKLMKSLPILQSQIDVLVEFDATVKDLSNPVLMAAFTLIYKDLIRLFASYNEGMINLIELYFTMSRKVCQEALAIYKSFLQLTEKVLKFVTVAENAGVGDKASLGLQTVPPKVLETLENHLANLEKRRTSQSDSDGGKSPTSAQPNVALPLKLEKAPNSTTKVPRKPDETKVKTAEQKVKPDRGKCPSQKPSDEPVSNDLLNDLFKDNANCDTVSSNTAVRTQLRRPEQQNSVAVTVKRAGRSPSPNRPSRPPQNRSRDASPARNDTSVTNVAEEKDFFLNLRDESSNLGISPTSPVTPRGSPFAADENNFGGCGSFWNTDDDQNKVIDFESAFNEAEAKYNKSQEQSATETNLLDIDLLGLDMAEESVVVNKTPAMAPGRGHSDLDDLLALEFNDGSAVVDAQPLMPMAPMAAVLKSNTESNYLDSLSFSGHNNNISSISSSTNVPIQQKPTANIVNKTNTPAKNADANLSDTLAFLADSLGKGENKWSSNTKKQTMTGHTIDAIGLSSGPTIDWSKSSATSSGSVTHTESANTATTTTASHSNNYNLLDLL